MKNSLFLTLLMTALLSCSLTTVAQSGAESRLKSRYGGQVQYHSNGGGWYLMSYYRDGVPLYGFADKAGNVVADGAAQFRIHKGFIELMLLDQAQKSLHDQWEADMRRYEQDFREYTRVKRNYEAELAEYEARVRAAKQEAQARYQYARKQAIAKAQREAQEIAKRNNASGWGSLFAGLGGAAAGSLAANAIKLEPFIAEVMSERDLTVPPYEPYNPVPEKPEEPESGYYWKSFPYRYPNPYDEVDYAAITDDEGFANVKKGGRYGLVDASLNQIYPCVNQEPVLTGTLGDLVLVRINGKLGLINQSAKVVVPNRYSSIVSCGTGYKVGIKSGESEKFGLVDANGKELMACDFDAINLSENYLLCSKQGAWGVYTADSNELYPCQYEEIQFLKGGKGLMLQTKKNGQWGVVDFERGTEILPNFFSEISLLEIVAGDPYIRAGRNKQYALFASDGKLLLPCEFSAIKKSRFGEYIYVEQNNTVGLYNREGVAILEPGLYSSYTFQSPFYIVKAHGLTGVCGLYGQPLVECKYQNLIYNPSLNGFIASKEEGGTKRWGIVNLVGEELFPFVEASELEYKNSSHHYLTVRSPLGTVGAIDFEGKTIVPAKLKDRTKLGAKTEKYAKKNDLTGPWKRGVEGLSEAGDFLESSNQSIATKHRRFDFYARHYVERDINEWQKRREFEREEDWKRRVNEQTRRQRVHALTKALQQHYVDQQTKGLKDRVEIIGSYNAGNETFRLRSSITGKEFSLKVPASEAMAFKDQFDQVEKLPRFRVEGQGVELDSYLFRTPSGNCYTYRNVSRGNTLAQVEYQFKPASETRGGMGIERLSTRSISVGGSDVDQDIPAASRIREKTYAVIVANENYETESEVEYAYNDGQALHDYLVGMLGIPEDQVHFRADATLNELRFEVNWLREQARKAGEEAHIIFYYAGRSIVDSRTRASALLPIDGSMSNVSSGFPLQNLYKTLGALPAKQCLVLLDAGLSGAIRPDKNNPTMKVRTITPRTESLNGNIVVISSTTGVEYAQAYSEKQHGLFTYYLLKKLQESGGNLTYGQLADDVASKVKKQSYQNSRKSQTPKVTVSSKVYYKWRKMEL